MTFKWASQNDEHFGCIVQEAIAACRQQGVCGIDEHEMSLLFVCREFDKGRNTIQPFIKVGERIENPDEMMASIEGIALEYFDLPLFKLRGRTFFFAVAEFLPATNGYARAIAGVVDRGKTRRGFFNWRRGRP